MTDREKLVSTAQKYLGYKQADGSHKKIIDIYNAHTPRPRGYKVKYTDAWCATFVSAMAYLCGLDGIIPPECSCGYMVKAFQKLGCWRENENYTPKPGDIIFYDWDDKGSGDNTGAPDHVGIVEQVSGKTITVIEGNKSNSVSRRTIAVNGRYIRGYGLPKYSETAPTPATDLAFAVGDTVDFTGTTHYTQADGGAGRACVGGKATVSIVKPAATHPYHLIAVKGGGSNVYGWVKAEDVKAVRMAFEVGDVINFAGGAHYASADATVKAGTPNAGPAKITAIKANAKHPYHVVHTTTATSVWGWVDADRVTK